jgi:hypothetical protein
MCNNKYSAIITDPLAVPSLGRPNFALGRVLSPTQENTADLHSAGGFPYNSRRGRGGKERPYQKNLYHCMNFFTKIAIC